MVSYSFNQADKDFIFELAKVGCVSLTSSQVTLSPRSGGNFEIKNAFEDGMKLPQNWSIEYLGNSSNGVYITFKVTED